MSFHWLTLGRRGRVRNVEHLKTASLTRWCGLKRCGSLRCAPGEGVDASAQDMPRERGNIMARENDYTAVRDALTTLFADGVSAVTRNTVYKDALDAHARLEAERDRLTAECGAVTAVNTARGTALKNASGATGFDMATTKGQDEARRVIRRMRNLDRIVGSASAVICDFLREQVECETICDEGTRILEDLLPLMGIEAVDIIGTTICVDYQREQIGKLQSIVETAQNGLTQAHGALSDLNGERVSDDDAAFEAIDEAMGEAHFALDRLREIPEDALY